LGTTTHEKREGGRENLVVGVRSVEGKETRRTSSHPQGGCAFHFYEDLKNPKARAQDHRTTRKEMEGGHDETDILRTNAPARKREGEGVG